MKTAQLNLRIEADLIKQLEVAARMESLDRGTMLRKLLRQALTEYRRQRALDRYQSGELSIGRASEEAGLSHWEIVERSRDRGWAYPFDPQELESRPVPRSRASRVAETSRPYGAASESTTSKALTRRHRSRTMAADSAVATLPDRPPSPGGILLVGINPAPVSVASGHYYQGPLGRRLWKRLARIGLLVDPIPGSEDDAFVHSGHGLTDIVKRSPPRATHLRHHELRSGVEALRSKVQAWRPSLILFPFKQAATTLLGVRNVASGPNVDFEGVPTFLMAGPFVRARDASRSDQALRDLIARRR